MISIKNEKEYQLLVSKFLNQHGHFVYKIQDVGFSLKPFDLIANINGILFAIELKVANTSKTNIARLLKPHQLASLKHNYPLGYVCVYYKKEKANSLFFVNKTGQLENVIHLKKFVDIYDYLLLEGSKRLMNHLQYNLSKEHTLG